MELDKDCSIVDWFIDEVWSWNWRNQINGGEELRQFNELFNWLQEVVLSDQHDIWWWDIDIDGTFTASETRRWIDVLRLPNIEAETECNSFLPKK